MADTEEAEIASLLRDSHGICHAEIRVADHAENGLDTQATMVSTSTFDTVRPGTVSEGSATYTPSERSSVAKHAGASENPSGGCPVMGS